MAATTTTSTSLSSSSLLRSLFPDKDSVRIYPDDYYYCTVDDDTTITNTNTNTTTKKKLSKDLTIPELVDRRTGHFSSKRVVILFRPGSYEDINCPVGYWTQVLGLGETPHDVVFAGDSGSGGGGVYCLPANMDNPNVGSLDTFWRSAENFTSDCTVPTNSNIIIKNKTTTTTKNRQKNQSEEGGEVDESSWVIQSSSSSNPNNKGMVWAVSQAAPLRRIYVTHDLYLSLGANCSSGGFMADCNVAGNLNFGSQQQFCIRNCEIGLKAKGGAWSMVFCGCQSDCIEKEDDEANSNNSNNQNYSGGQQKIDWDGQPPSMVSCESTTKQQIEKPYMFIGGDDDDDETVYLAIPKMKRSTTGIDFNDKLDDDEKVIIDNKDRVRVVNIWTPFNEIQSAVDNGTHVILSPGIYSWGQTLHITKSNQVILGLGMATIQAPGDGKPCIYVSSNCQGVRLSGLALEASVISKFIYEGSTLLQWGDPPKCSIAKTSPFRCSSDVVNPNAMHDIYCFVGGRNLNRTVKVECMIKIYSNGVIGDNLWLWRADHVQLMENEQPNKPELSEYHVTTAGECRCDTGLEVHGDDVTFVGLAVEHTYKDMVSWYGRNGSVYFYQSELPYDVIGESSIKTTSNEVGTYSTKISGYRVNSSANGHTAKGVGVYSYFRDCPNISVENAIVDYSLKSQYVNCFTVWLNGYSGIKSVINGLGGVTKMPGKPVEVPSYQSRNSVLTSKFFWIGLLRDGIGGGGSSSFQHLMYRGWTFLLNHLFELNRRLPSLKDSKKK